MNNEIIERLNTIKVGEETFTIGDLIKKSNDHYCITQYGILKAITIQAEISV